MPMMPILYLLFGLLNRARGAILPYTMLRLFISISSGFMHLKHASLLLLGSALVLNALPNKISFLADL